MFVLLSYLTDEIRHRWTLVRDTKDRGGYSTEAVLITAGLVLLALAVIAIIAGKVESKAENIDLG